MTSTEQKLEKLTVSSDKTENVTPDQPAKTPDSDVKTTSKQVELVKQKEQVDLEKKSDLLDTLYMQCFNQLIRTEISPVHVERRVLEEIVGMVRRLLLECATDVRKLVDADAKAANDSYLTWNREYHAELAKERKESIREFEKRVRDTKPHVFMSEDFTKISDELQTSYPNTMPKSSVRAHLWEQWSVLKNKKD